MNRKATKRMKQLPFMLVLQAPNGTDVVKMPITNLPPLDDDPEMVDARGEVIGEFVTDGILDYFAFLLKVKKKCNCLAAKEDWLDPYKHAHSGGCRWMNGS